MKKKLPLIILLILALATRFIFLAYPSEVVFDEVHFGKFVSSYFNHQYYFDIHPPLGKLMIAGFSSLLGFQPGQTFGQIGEQANARQLFVLRFLPALFGALLALVFYALVCVLGGSKKAAFLAGFLIIFDNAFLIESKFILVDSILYFFGFSSILVFLASRKQEDGLKKYLFYFVSMALAGLAFSIKWTGLSFLGIILLFSVFSFLKNISLKRFLKFFAEVIVSLLLVAVIYILPFAIHFKLLYLSGPGDAFMSQSFQTKSFLDKTAELNDRMFFYNSTLAKDHPDASKWHEWPLIKKPVWYWSKDKTANIYLFGNPLVWLPALSSLFLGFFASKKKRWAVFFLITGFLANLLPFIMVSRIAFLYHYLPALAFAIILLSVLLDGFMEKHASFFYLYLGMAILAFLAISPLSYGLPLSIKAVSVYQLIISLFH
jgi:dolichyl-phosphate-mannose-protein mannosyltransferase